MINSTEKSDEILFPSFETLGNTWADPEETRRTWKRVFAGLLAGSVVVAAMLPVALENEVRSMRPGPIENQLVSAARWWREDMLLAQANRPADGVRERAHILTRIGWKRVYCLTRESRWGDFQFRLPAQFAGDQGGTPDCE